MFDQLKKVPIPKLMPFTEVLAEDTKFLTLDTWIGRQIKNRKARLEKLSAWSREKVEGYEQGMIDALLDAKNEIRRLNGR